MVPFILALTARPGLHHLTAWSPETTGKGPECTSPRQPSRRTREHGLHGPPVLVAERRALAWAREPPPPRPTMQATESEQIKRTVHTTDFWGCAWWQQVSDVPGEGTDYQTLIRSLEHHNIFRVTMSPGHETVKVAESCPTLCDPMDCIVPGIL